MTLYLCRRLGIGLALTVALGVAGPGVAAQTEQGSAGDAGVAAHEAAGNAQLRSRVEERWRVVPTRDGLLLVPRQTAGTVKGVEITAELANGPRSLIGRQVENGVPVRMAVLALLAGTA